MKQYEKIITRSGIGLLALISSQSGTFAASREKMNVVFLLADDLRWNTLGCMGNPVVITPNIDQLAKDGVRFNNACVTTAICMVSRASILSGEYMSRHRLTKFSVELPEKVLKKTYPAVLREGGYWTGYVGKYGVGKLRAENYDYSSVYEGKHWILLGKGDSIHVTAKNEKDALSFLRDRPKDKPFLLSVGFFAPHAEDSHPDQYRYQPQSEKYYQDVNIPIPKTATVQALESLPPFIRSEENAGRIRWHWRFDTPEKYQKYMKAYYRMVTEVDLAVGRIVAELKAQGIYDNTLIIFMGDNGYFQSDHMLADKWYPYEESIRVPLIVHDPRLPESKRNCINNEFVLNIDIAPTIMAATAMDIPQNVQGHDFSSLYLKEKPPVWRQDFYYEHPVVNSKAFIPASEALVTHRDKYIFWVDNQYEEYFNLNDDRYEEHNLISGKDNEKRIDTMKKRMKKLKQKAK